MTRLALLSLCAEQNPTVPILEQVVESHLSSDNVPVKKDLTSLATLGILKAQKQRRQHTGRQRNQKPILQKRMLTMSRLSRHETDPR